MTTSSTAIPIRQANVTSRTCSQVAPQQLFPRIPDEITLAHIIPLLPWKVIEDLAVVSGAWLHAIRSRKVYDARVLSHSRETLVVISLYHYGGISLWSPRDNSRIDLPHHGRRGQLVSLNGNIYLLGGENYPFGNDTSDKVFVYDVAGSRQWKRCANMCEARTDFGCGVMHGKIYVFGGVKFEVAGVNKFCGSEVYDPEKDLWSPIKPMGEKYDHRVETLGELFYVHSRRDRYKIQRRVPDVYHPLDIYHPFEDEWRVVNRFGRDSSDVLFVARGRVHAMTVSGVDFYDAEEDSWTELHSFSFPFFGPALLLADVLVVDEELLVKVLFHKSSHMIDVCRAKSKGFGSEKKEIVWQQAPSALRSYKLTTILL